MAQLGYGGRLTLHWQHRLRDYHGTAGNYCQRLLYKNYNRFVSERRNSNLPGFGSLKIQPNTFAPHPEPCTWFPLPPTPWTSVNYRRRPGCRNSDQKDASFYCPCHKLPFVDLCSDCEANVPYCGPYTAQRLPGLWILPATHALSQAHRNGFPFTAHSERETNLKWKLIVVQLSDAES